MAVSLKDTKRRIQSVKNTQKITRAMKLVSAAKFARANNVLHQNKPYSQKSQEMFDRVMNSNFQDFDHPLLAKKEFGRSVFILISTDRGLCGSMNTNLLRRFENWLGEKKLNQESYEIWAWGKKATQFCNKKKWVMKKSIEKAIDKVSIEKAKAYSQEIISAVYDEGVKEVWLVYTAFQSALTQRPEIRKIYPFISNSPQSSFNDFTIEPDQKNYFENLVEHYIQTILYRVLLEAQASEHGARMTAMDSATNNAKEVIRKLTLDYNRARQAAITKELIEIISGAEAL